MIGSDDFRECPPGVSVGAKTPAEIDGRLAIHEVKAEREFLRHLLLPLRSERCRTKDKHATYTPTENELR